MDNQLLGPQVQALFPLRTVGDVLRLFEAELDKPCCLDPHDPTGPSGPNLALLSIVVGAIENVMTGSRNVPAVAATAGRDEVGPRDRGQGSLAAGFSLEPQVDFHTVQALYSKFESTIRGLCDPDLLLLVVGSASTGSEARGHDGGDEEADRGRQGRVRTLVKHVADIVWNTLSKSQYKDRPHLQSIYSYLTGNKLDCFGVAFAVVAACQVLGVQGVHLALSEDHAWVVFGGGSRRGQPGVVQTAEVTWHGKGSEDKRGQPVDEVKARTSWLYLAGRPVFCDRFMEVSALVNGINPAIDANTDSLEVGEMQKELLWLLYDRGHLRSYPMALDNLADLEEVSPSPGRPHCTRLYEEAIEVAKNGYGNHHVYPYTYQGGYFYRTQDYRRALEAWANASDAVARYNYSKDDEEIYKEFMEIGNELIPHIVKVELARGKGSTPTGLDPGEGGPPGVLGDPECFRQLLRFYDGICCWEEGSATPVLHIGWAKPMVSTVSKFDASVRGQLVLALDGNGRGRPPSDNDEEVDAGGSKPAGKHGLMEDHLIVAPENSCGKRSSSSSSSAVVPRSPPRREVLLAASKNNNNNNNTYGFEDKYSGKAPKPRSPRFVVVRDGCEDNEEALMLLAGSDDDNDISSDACGAINEECSLNSNSCSSGDMGNHCLEAKARDPGRLEGPFSPGSELQGNGDCCDSDKEDIVKLLSDNCGKKMLSMSYLLGQSPVPFVVGGPLQVNGPEGARTSKTQKASGPEALAPPQGPRPQVADAMRPLTLQLHSAKMLGMQNLLCSTRKLNVGAIQLQLTAQSQTEMKKSCPQSAFLSSGYSFQDGQTQAFGSYYSSSRPKRLRRD